MKNFKTLWVLLFTLVLFFAFTKAEEPRTEERPLDRPPIQKEKMLELRKELVEEKREQFETEAEAQGLTPEEYKEQLNTERKEEANAKAEEMGITIEEYKKIMDEEKREEMKEKREELKEELKDKLDDFKEEREEERFEKLEAKAEEMGMTIEEYKEIMKEAKQERIAEEAEKMGVTVEEYEEIMKEKREKKKEEMKERTKERIEKIIKLWKHNIKTHMDIEEGEDGYKRVTLSNGKYAAIKIMPEVAAERAIERLHSKKCLEEDDCQIELKEVGQGDETKAVYEIKTRKEVKILWLFRARMKITTQVDAEDGEVIKDKKPRRSFFTRSSDDTDDVDDTEEEVAE